MAEFTLYGVAKITGDDECTELSKAKSTFLAVYWDLESPGRSICLLIGMDHMEDTSREQKRGKNLVLYKSVFGTGYMYGVQEHGWGRTEWRDLFEPVNNPESAELQDYALSTPPEFIPAESMGTELPRRCPECKSCKECQFWMGSLSFKENTQYEIILSKLKGTVARDFQPLGFSTNRPHIVPEFTS